jgi:hypothetical protein
MDGELFRAEDVASLDRYENRFRMAHSAANDNYSMPSNTLVLTCFIMLESSMISSLKIVTANADFL